MNFALRPHLNRVHFRTAVELKDNLEHRTALVFVINIWTVDTQSSIKHMKLCAASMTKE